MDTHNTDEGVIPTNYEIYALLELISEQLSEINKSIISLSAVISGDQEENGDKKKGRAHYDGYIGVAAVAKRLNCPYPELTTMITRFRLETKDFKGNAYLTNEQAALLESLYERDKREAEVVTNE